MVWGIVHVCVYVYAYIYVVGYVRMHVHACMHIGQRLVPCGFFFFSVSFRLIFLKKYLTLNLELSGSVRLAT